MGLALLTYLTVLWFEGHPIGRRPLLMFGVLLVLVGSQIVFTGLLADLIVNMNPDTRQQLPLKYASDLAEESDESDRVYAADDPDA